jgi:hypothetical protein
MIPKKKKLIDTGEINGLLTLCQLSYLIQHLAFLSPCPGHVTGIHEQREEPLPFPSGPACLMPGCVLPTPPDLMGVEISIN